MKKSSDMHMHPSTKDAYNSNLLSYTSHQVKTIRHLYSGLRCCEKILWRHQALQHDYYFLLAPALPIMHYEAVCRQCCYDAESADMYCNTLHHDCCAGEPHPGNHCIPYTKAGWTVWDRLWEVTTTNKQYKSDHDVSSSNLHGVGALRWSKTQCTILVQQDTQQSNEVAIVQMHSQAKYKHSRCFRISNFHQARLLEIFHPVAAYTHRLYPVELH